MSGSTDPFDSLDDRAVPGDDALPAELEPLHQRILSDSAAWRAELPDIAPLERQVASLATQRREQLSSFATTYSTREESIMPDVPDTSDPVRVDTREETTTRPIPPAPHRSGLRSLLAAGSALALVALFAIFFVALPHGGKTGGGPGEGPIPSTPTPGTAVRHGVWLPLAALAHTPGVPVVAPSNPSVVYEDDHAHLRRSDDGGKTWTDLALPSDFPSGDSYTWLDLFVSPLDANTVWATADLVDPNNPASCPFGAPTAFTGGNAVYGGSVPCQVQHVSTDGGKTWKLAKLSFGFVLGTNSADMTTGNGYYPYSAPPQAQGSRLYTMTDDGPLAASATAAHLAVSDDDGATWHDASAALTSAGHYVCAFAAVPAGSTVFAVTSDAGCGPDYSNSGQTLWRSDDAGTHWTQASLPANRIVLSLVVAGGSQPTLYAAMPSLSGNSHVGVTMAAPADIFASADGGASWHAAPASGVPFSSTTSGPLVALSDGSVVQPFYVRSSLGADGKGTVAFGRWHVGDSAWSQLKSLHLYGVAQMLAVADAAGSGDTLWLSVPDTNTPANVTYSVQTYTP